MQNALPWFREYHQALNDPRVQRLDPVLFKTWFNLRCLASQQAVRGFLPNLTACAFALRMEERSMAEQIHHLREAGLLDLHPHPATGAEELHITGWEEEQFVSDNVTLRVRKHRAKAAFPRPSEPVVYDETLHETLHETGNETLHVTTGNVPGNVRDTDTDTDTEGEREGEQNWPVEIPRARLRARTRAPSEAPLEFNLYEQDLLWWREKLAQQPQLPQDWGSRQWLANQRDHFLAKSRSAGKLSHDWNAEWQSWLLREITLYVGPRAPSARAGRVRMNGGGANLDATKYAPGGTYGHLFHRARKEEDSYGSEDRE